MTALLDRLAALRDHWRAEANELDEATNGMWIEPSVKRNCADELDELLSATPVAGSRVAPSEEPSEPFLVAVAGSPPHPTKEKE